MTVVPDLGGPTKKIGFIFTDRRSRNGSTKTLSKEPKNALTSLLCV